MKSGARKRTRPRARRAWFVIGAVLGTVPQLNAEVSQSIPARPAHAIHLDARRVQASLSHIKVWTPSETIPLLTADGAERPGFRPAPGARADARAGGRVRAPGSPAQVRDCARSTRRRAPAVRAGHRPHDPRRRRPRPHHDDRRSVRHDDRRAGPAATPGGIWDCRSRLPIPAPSPSKSESCPTRSTSRRGSLPCRPRSTRRR